MGESSLSAPTMVAAAGVIKQARCIGVLLASRLWCQWPKARNRSTWRRPSSSSLKKKRRTPSVGVHGTCFVLGFGFLGLEDLDLDLAMEEVSF